MGNCFFKPNHKIYPVAKPLVLVCQAEELTPYFERKGLLCAVETKALYAKVTAELLAMFGRFNNLPQHDLTVAMDAFQQSFSRIALAEEIVELAPQVADFQTVAQENLQVLVQSVAATMDAGLNQYKLIYHSKLHAYEIAMDVAKDLQVETKSCQLLAFICALYHDVQFTHQRIIDEEASVQICLAALQPIFRDMPGEQVEVIKDLIRVVILAGTIPCLLQKDGYQDQACATMPALIEVLNQLSPGLDEACPIIVNMCRSLARMDVHRTSSPKVYQCYSLYVDECWEKLKRFYQSFPLQTQLSLQRKLTQNLRTMFEMALKDGAQNTIAQYAFDLLTRNPIGSLVVASADMIAFGQKLVNGPFSEKAFAERFENTGKVYPASQSDDYQPFWREHREFLQRVGDFLQDEIIPVSEKAEVVEALAKAALYQDGLFFKLEQLPNFLDHQVQRNVIK
jgi:hypothetical protein